MLQHYFRYDSSNCLSSTSVNKIPKHSLLMFVSYICYWYIHETVISKYIQIFNTFLFHFAIVMNEINTLIMWHWNPLIKLNIIVFKLNACWNFNLHTYAITLVLVKITIFVSLFYVYGDYFSFRLLIKCIFSASV